MEPTEGSTPSIHATASPAGSGSAIGGALSRARDMLLRPGATWHAVAQEDDSIARICKEYLIYLAAVPAVAGFIGQSLVGVGAFGVTVRVPIVQGLVSMVVGYVLTLALVYVMALAASALAPRFQGQAHMSSAFKLLVYGATAGMLGGVFSLLPSLAMLGLVAALYSIYLIYQGAPVLMRVPTGKAVGYTAALVGCAVVLGLLVGGVSALLMPRGATGLGGLAGADGGNVKISVPGTKIEIDTAKVEAASRRMEQAQARGDAQEAGKAMGEALSAALGGQGGTPIAADTLKGLMPATLAGMPRMPRMSADARTEGMAGMQFSSVTAQFSDGGRMIELRMLDIGAVPMLAMGMASWSRATVDRETADEVERVYQKDGVSYKEEYRKDGSRSSLAMLLPNGLLLDASGPVPMPDLRTALQEVPVGRLAALAR